MGGGQIGCGAAGVGALRWHRAGVANITSERPDHLEAGDSLVGPAVEPVQLELFRAPEGRTRKEALGE